MKRGMLFLGLFAALAALALATAGPLRAETVTAKAGSGGVTAHTFVKLSAAGTIVTATAASDKVVGVAEDTASANGMTRYTLPGGRTTVTSGGIIAVGDLLIATTGGKALALATDELYERICGLALTAAGAADLPVEMIVVASSCGQRFTPGGSTTVAGDVLVIPVTHALVAKTTANDAEALTLADGTPGQVRTVVLVTDGGGDGTLTPSRKTGFSTIVFADAGDTATLMYVDDTVGWVILGTAGVAAPPVIS